MEKNKTILGKEKYNDFFNWLFDKKDIKLEEEIDSSKFFDEESKYVYYTPEIKSFFETKAMKRLGYIGQIVNVSYKNVCSVHTRLAHCKGAYQNVVDFYIKKFQNSDWREKNFDKDSKLKILADMMDMASHDIGHTVFSHALESLIGNYHGAHEVLGNRILNEDEEVVQTLKNINPDLLLYLQKVKNKKHYLHSLKEGNIDFDRADFLVRDSIQLNIENGIYNFNGETKTNFELLNEIFSECDMYNINFKGENIDVPVFSYKVEPQIEEILKRRKENYKYVYTSKDNKTIDFMLEEFCKNLMELDDTKSELVAFLKNMSQNDINEIDLKEFIEWNDIRFYNSIFEIIDNTKNSALKDFAIICLPNLKNLMNLVYERMILNVNPKIDENGNEIKTENEFFYDYEKSFYLRIKKFVENEGSFENYIKNHTLENSVFNVTFNKKEKQEKFLKQLELTFGISKDAVELLNKDNWKIKTYSQKNGIFIKNENNKIFTFDEYPERKLDISNIEYYSVIFIEDKLKANGISDLDVMKCKIVFEKMCEKHKKSKVEERLNSQDTRLCSELIDLTAEL